MTLRNVRTMAFLAAAALMLGMSSPGHTQVGKGGGVRSAGNHPASNPTPQHAGPAMNRPSPSPGPAPVLGKGPNPSKGPQTPAVAPKTPAVTPKPPAGFQRPTPPAGGAGIPKKDIQPVAPKTPVVTPNTPAVAPKTPGTTRPNAPSNSQLNDFLGGGQKPATKPATPVTPKLPTPKEVIPGKKDQPEEKFPKIDGKLPKKDQPEEKFPKIDGKLPKKDQPEEKFPKIDGKLPKKDQPEEKFPKIDGKLPKKDQPEEKFPKIDGKLPKKDQPEEKFPKIDGKLPKKDQPEEKSQPNINIGNVNIGNTVDYNKNQQAWINNQQTTGNQVRVNAGNRYATAYSGADYRRGYAGGYDYHSSWNRRGPFYGWSPVGYVALGTFMGAAILNTTKPVYYAYGSGGNVYYENNVVYVNGAAAGTPAEYSSQARELVAAAPATVTETEWMPLGAFAFTREGVDDSQAMIELAVTKSGIIGGTYFNEATGVSRPLKGTVDAKTQRVLIGFADGKNEKAVLETGIYNLTQDEAPALLHHGDEETTPVLLVRLKAPEEPAK